MIKAPRWAKDARPTLRGWETPKGELLISRRHTQAQVDEFFGVKKEVKKVKVKVKTEKPKTKRVKKTKEVTEKTEMPGASLLIEAPANDKALNEMISAEVEAIENQYNVKVGTEENQVLVEKNDTSE